VAGRGAWRTSTHRSRVASPESCGRPSHDVPVVDRRVPHTGTRRTNHRRRLHPGHTPFGRLPKR
jgi:hypothetical protein